MLARSRPLALRSGATLETPILIPSFSSRGFGIRSDGMSEVATHLEIAKDHLTEAALVSAYDLYHSLLPDSGRLAEPDHWDSMWAIPQLLVVDSGGYELNAGWDGSELRWDEREPRPFSRTNFESVVDTLPVGRDTVVVSWDHLEPGQSRSSYREQANEARELALRRPDLMVDVLLKPPVGCFIDPVEVDRYVGDLVSAEVIGVTEKELGDSIVSRTSTLASLRSTLDVAGVAAPIHVFGVLDPVFIGLYFSAGAEIFDGLAWLRYGLHEGLSVFREAAALARGDLESPGPVRIARTQLHYLSELASWKRVLREFASTGDIFTLGAHAPVIQSTLNRAGITT